MTRQDESVPRRVHAEFLQDLCLGLLKNNWQNDGTASNVASALLTTVAHQSPFESHSQVFEKRAHRALSLLRKIEEFQSAKEKHEIDKKSVYADRYPKTKAVLWEALFLGAFMSERPKRQQFFARNLLCLRDFGLPGDDSEFEKLRETLRNTLFNYQVRSERIGAILKECTEKSNPAVSRILGHAYVNFAWPNDIARMCRT